MRTRHISEQFYQSLVVASLLDIQSPEKLIFKLIKLNYFWVTETQTWERNLRIDNELYKICSIEIDCKEVSFFNYILFTVKQALKILGFHVVINESSLDSRVDMTVYRMVDYEHLISFDK